MFELPAYAYLFIFAALAAIAGKVFSGRVRDDPGSFPALILYAVAVGCVVVGFATIWLNRQV